ncbi:hypothetical protein FF36_05112 [Frankia torreyi]|uniref:Uncharacterized protein n=1 Tax=Frankia torreyi TaxID=1856 RepID=A0A0D8BB47_9ACTN|nr:hypothetical protein FF36_05112 [Frankia torreyi]KQM02915.1 hypothetical protein FF86_105213 [Frankia sp. CpI1-P]
MPRMLTSRILEVSNGVRRRLGAEVVTGGDRAVPEWRAGRLGRLG